MKNPEPAPPELSRAFRSGHRSVIDAKISRLSLSPIVTMKSESNSASLKSVEAGDSTGWAKSISRLSFTFVLLCPQTYDFDWTSVGRRKSDFDLLPFALSTENTAFWRDGRQILCLAKA